VVVEAVCWVAGKGWVEWLRERRERGGISSPAQAPRGQSARMRGRRCAWCVRAAGCQVRWGRGSAACMCEKGTGEVFPPPLRDARSKRRGGAGGRRQNLSFPFQKEEEGTGMFGSCTVVLHAPCRPSLQVRAVRVSPVYGIAGWERCLLAPQACRSTRCPTSPYGLLPKRVIVEMLGGMGRELQRPAWGKHAAWWHLWLLVLSAP